VFDPFPMANNVVSRAIELSPSANTVDAPVGEGCFAIDGGSCTYRAHVAGGVDATGSTWWVEITRGSRQIRLGPGAYGDPADVYGSTFVRDDVIRPGDSVFAATGSTSPPWVGFVHVGPINGNRR
jgi:hypothetical protein